MIKMLSATVVSAVHRGTIEYILVAAGFGVAVIVALYQL
jgi:hypothetical protein